MKQDEFLDLALACLANEATEQQRRMLGELIAADPARRALFDALAENWQGTFDGEDVSTDWQKVQARTQQASPGNGKWFTVRPWLVAAMLICCAGIGWLVAVKQPAAMDQAELTVIEAGTAVKDSVWLPDGTYVRLNKGARIAYPAKFEEAKRQVHLEGEGYFQVAKNPAKPFIIDVGESEVKVLGTAFNVKENKGDTTVLVAVMEGLVSVSGHTKNHDPTVLKAGYVGLVSRNGIQVSQGNTANYLSWYSNRLVFENISLPEVSRQLEHLYGVNIVIKSKELKSLALTANIHQGSLTDVISKIAYSLDMHYRVDNSGTVELFK